ncbi:hypothetical protein TNCV_2113701 [Trichonephila clavipes]|nr:hypothetical protein TNCV_2113701 [Trichonephila clavipes]
MLIQPNSSLLEFVRGTVVLMENTITKWITEQHKRMESALSSRNRDSPIHATRFQSYTLQSLCSLPQERRAARWRALSYGTLIGRRLSYCEASIEKSVYWRYDWHRHSTGW